DAELHRGQERRRPAREAVQEIEDRIPLLRVPAVARREVDVDELPATAERRAAHVELLGGSGDLDKRRIVRRCETAIAPEGMDVAEGAQRADREECAKGEDEAR